MPAAYTVENLLSSLRLEGTLVASIIEIPKHAHTSKGGARIENQEPSKRLHRYPEMKNALLVMERIALEIQVTPK
ncbi:MAG: hypothetical protein MKZ70_04840 [Opitutales bacterium]|nr:hypothetical protein [Opitutales bacterium]